MNGLKDTIYALSTPLGNGVAVVRISGKDSLKVLRSCFSYSGEYESHKMYYGKMLCQGQSVDEGLAVLFKAPRSYTGEDCAELHCHGSYGAMRQVLKGLSKAGIRQAQPGEFTKRAFLNGKMDLSQAEAVMDLIHANAQAGAKVALEQLEGSLAREVGHLQEVLTDCIAQLEAGIDYPEEDWEEELSRQAEPQIREVLQGIEKLISSGAQGRLLRDGLRIVLIGRPNVGKSSLLNALLGENRAIVSDIPGTTRDLIEECMDWKGLPVWLTDTAGMRRSSDKIEQIGVDLSKKAMEQADLVLLMFDGSQPLGPEDAEIIALSREFPRIGVISKGDLPQVFSEKELKEQLDCPIVCLSARNQQGLEELKDLVREHFDALSPREKPPALVSNRRHLDALEQAGDSLKEALSSLGSVDLDCLTIDLRSAWRFLGDITGNAAEEKIIERIFSRFCLGK